MDYRIPPEPLRYPDAKTGFLHAVRLRDTAVEAAARLAEAGIPSVVLKGVALAAYGAPPPGERHSADVDLLVPRPRLDEAATILRHAGWQGGEPGIAHGIARSLRDHPRLLPVDLHGELLGPGRARLDGADVLLRARPAPAWLPATLLVPDPLDLFAHLAAHAAYNLVIEGRRHHPEDLTRLVETLHLDPARIAAHLHRTGLAASAALVLGHAGLEESDTRKRLLAALQRPWSRSTDALATRALATPPHSAPRRLLHLLLADHPVDAGLAGLRRHRTPSEP